MDSQTRRSIQKKLTRWYERVKRDLPWRRTRDPYAIWISEVMLQQTRVAAVIPYYERFLQRFPDARALAAAPENELLAMWAGLGYYSRARNLQKGARQIDDRGSFPGDYESILELAGVGTYTAAAIASIAFDLPHAVVDGNVRRVLTRISDNGDVDAQIVANQLLNRRDPARWNQAVMELGATVCLPREPRCEECPIAAECLARQAGTQTELPPKRKKREPEILERTLLIIRRGGRTLFTPSSRVDGFFDLPEPFHGARIGAVIGEFKHTITHRHYRFVVKEAVASNIPKEANWFTPTQLKDLPLATTAKKALALYRSV